MKTTTSRFPESGARTAVILTTALVGAMLLCVSARAVERQVLLGHLPPAVAKLQLQPIGRLPATNQLRLAIGLPLRNTNEMARLLQEMYDPASPQFRHYLTLEQFTERFGPTKEDYEAVKPFALKHGLEVTVTHPNRVVLDVAGPVAAIESALNIKLHVYEHPTEGRTFYAPDREPSVEAGLAVLDISGLNNFVRPRPALHRDTSSVSSVVAGGSGPAGSLLGNDFRNAYAPGVTLTGAGQIVGLVEFDAYSLSDVTTYEDLAGLPHVPLQHILLDGYDGIPDGTGGQAEADLDIDMAVSMAPGLSKVVLFDAGTSGNLLDILNSMVVSTSIKQFSSSWGGGGPPYTSYDNIFRQMALQGQSFLIAGGDGESWNTDPLMPISPIWPEDDPYLTSVGGTSLRMTGDGATYASETVWNDGYLQKWYGAAGLGTGGGISTNYAIQAWQTNINMSANHGSTTRRNYPDVAMVADHFALVHEGIASAGWWGTSFAAPLWAGFTALVNQEAAANGEPAVGFLNPTLYAVGQSLNYTNCFHDITTGNNDASPFQPKYPAVPGYDLCSGWGTPKGSALIHTLALPQRLGVTPSSTLSFAGTVGGAVSPSIFNLTLTNRLGSLVWLAGQTAPWLSLSPTYGTLVAGGSSTTISLTPSVLASNLAAGSYTATLFFTNLSDQSVVTRQINLAMAGPPVITSQPTNVTVSEGTTVGFSVSTAINAPLTYRWQFDNGSSTNYLADGGNISGSGTSALTIGNVSLANAGMYSMVVSDSSGAATSFWATLTVLTGQPPAIVAQPSSQTVLPGATASFTVIAAGDAPLGYSWQLNGTNLANGGNISGSGTSRLSVANIAPADAGSYSVLITNSFGSVTSALAVLAVPATASPSVALVTRYSFPTNGIYGAYPYAGLLQANDGHFYGTASGGGADGWGTVFRWTTNGVIGLVHAFGYSTDGAVPYAALIQATNGWLYGTAIELGSQGNYGLLTDEGTVFRMSTSGTVTNYTLNSASSGSVPYGPLVQGRDGSFYGTAAYGGADRYGSPWGYGTVFKLTPGGPVTALGTFNFEVGANPASALVQAGDGSFYGTAQSGGTNGGFGTIFKITLAGAITALHSFGKSDGAQPIAGLTQDADGSFYGTTYAGGAANAGTLFKLGPDGTFTSLYSFTGGNDGSNCYGGLLLASDGNFYGTTEGGGAYSLGTVYRISREGVLTTLASFDGYQGAVPECTLIQATDGNLYGTTQFGGAGNLGAIFQISFDSPLQITEQPQSQAAYAGDSVTFSVATFGGLPITYQWLRDGTNLVDGGNILGSSSRLLTLTNVAAADAATYSVVVSNIYGQVTSVGASLQVNQSAPQLVAQPQSQTVLAGTTVTFPVQANGDGSLSYQWQENGTNLVDGGNLSGSATPTLTLDSVVATNAGTYAVVISNRVGSVTSSPAVLTVLPVSAPSASLRDVLPFTSANGGSFNPYAGVIQGTNGNFYGTTLNGGAEGFGSVFELTPFGNLAVLYSFTNGADGASPFAGLVQASDGNFYGASSPGAGSPFGTLFKLTPTGAFTPLYSFTGGADGGNPIGSLVQVSGGMLYGTASTGGSNGFGAVFSLSTNGVFTPLWSFRSSDGSSPAGPLLADTQGQLYGTTTLGGSNNLGTVFRLSTNGVLTSLASFDYTAGAYPSNGLVQAADGSFYGTASAGGTNGGWGTVFRLTADGSLTALHSFNYQDGAVPVGGLVWGADGNLYGTTSQGGVGGQGTVFQMTTNGLLTTLVWFDGPNGANPEGTLIQGQDGAFYGTAEFGGNQFDGASSSGDGLVFRLTVDSLGISPSTGFSATGPIGGPFSLATQTFVLTNTSSSSLTWSVINPAGNWLAVAPSNGVLAANATTNVVVSFSAAAEILGTGIYTTNLVFTNWSTHVAQSEAFGLQIGQTIVQNGGFETGDFTDWTLVGDTVINGVYYNVVLGDGSGYDVVHSGNYGAFLGDGILATLSQTLPTTPGQDYLLSLWLDNPASGSPQQFQVKWNGTTLYNRLNPPAFAWTNLQFIVTARGASTVLQFGAENGPNYFGLDDISVTPIPAVAFHSVVAGPTSFSLAWMTASGLTYQVQYKTNLSQPNWVALGPATLAAGFPLSISDTNGVQSSPQRFYRLVVSP